MPIRKILVPVDGSEGACRAARFAAELAHDLGAGLTLLYVFDSPAVTSLGLVAKGDLEETKEYVSRGSFDAAAKAIGGVEVKLDRHVDIGDPAARIVTVAEGGKYDLIVMGRRGLSPVRELMIGSVSERVSRRSPCPVTVVH